MKWTRRLTTRDGRTLVGDVHGSGSPTVVLEAGLGASGNCWGAVSAELRDEVTVVAYDRSGLGRSEADTTGRDLRRVSSDLCDVLDQLDGPFVLVGHSWGGPIVRSCAAGRSDVAGLVLVDQTDEHCELFFSPANRRQTSVALGLTPVLARLGLLRLVARRLSRRLPEPWATRMRVEDGTVAAARTQVAELRANNDDLVTLRQDPPRLPEVPVVVVSGARPGFGERGRRPELIEAHRATAASLPLGRHVLAERSSHHVPLTEPDVVADAVRSVASRG